MFYYVSYENRAVLEKMWKNTVVPGRQMTIWSMRIACWMTKATSTHTHTQYVILTGFFTVKMVARTCLDVTLYVH